MTIRLGDLILWYGVKPDFSKIMDVGIVTKEVREGWYEVYWSIDKPTWEPEENLVEMESFKVIPRKCRVLQSNY